jgi:hypothetical protein
MNGSFEERWCCHKKDTNNKEAEGFSFCFFVVFGAGDRGRTGTVSPPLDFESSTSANSITPAKLDLIIQHIISKHKRKFSFFKIFMFILHFRSPLAFRF